MLIKRLLILLLVAGATNAYSQKYILSSTSIDDPGFEHIKVIGQDDDGFYVLQSNLSLNIDKDRVGFKNRKYKVGYYDFKLQLKWSKKLDTEGDQSGLLVTMFAGHPIIIRSSWLKGESTVTFTTEMFDQAGNTVNRKPTGKINYDKSSEVGKARLIVSKSNELASIVVEELRENDQRFHFIVIDTSFNVMRSESPLISYSSKQLEVTDVALSDDGNLAALAQHVEKNPNDKKTKLIQYKLFLLPLQASVFKESAISMSNRQLTEASLTMDNINGKAVVTGFYNDNGSYMGTGIIFASQPFSALQEMTMKIVKIDDNARMKLVGERHNGANTGLYSYPIRKLILRSDGGAVVIAEAAYYNEYSYYDYFTQSFITRVEYHYDNVVIMSIHTDGSIDWSSVLRKSQETIDDGGYLSSFSTVLQSSQIDLIYNNDISKGNEVVAYEVSNKGVPQEKNITKAEDHITIIPQSGKQVDENTLITAALQKRKLYLMKIEM